MGKQLNLGMVVDPHSGALNPQFVEWLMGYPIDHTASKDWATQSSRKSRKKSSDVSQKSKDDK
jgi:hypothetical protein